MRDYTDKLVEMAGRNEKETPKYQKLCDEVSQKRARIKGPFVERVYEVLRKIIPEAEARGLKLGCENREALEELPLEEDFQFLFRELPSPSLVSWHDCGHAQIKENLGFIHHAMHLESLAEKLFGFHIHDVQFPGRDHCTPGSGTVDFAALKPFVKPEHVKVFEFSPQMSVADLQGGVAHIKKLWGE